AGAPPAVGERAARPDQVRRAGARGAAGVRVLLQPPARRQGAVPSLPRKPAPRRVRVRGRAADALVQAEVTNRAAETPYLCAHPSTYPRSPMAGTPVNNAKPNERKLNFWERIYLPEIFRGLKYSAEKMAAPTYTFEYPDEQWY